MLKSQDVGVLLKLIAIENRNRRSATALPDTAQYTVRALAAQTGISKSQMSLILQRVEHIGLWRLNAQCNAPQVNRPALRDFIIYAIRYTFPAQYGAIGRGIATGFAAPAIAQKLMSAGQFIPVWPDSASETQGQIVTPLFTTVPYAIQKDAEFYTLLAWVDCIRLGQARERKVAIEHLTELFEPK
jgi:hypothetical protein